MKLMKRRGENTPIHYDEHLFNLDPSRYEVYDSDDAPVAQAKARKPRAKPAASPPPPPVEPEGSLPDFEEVDDLDG